MTSLGFAVVKMTLAEVAEASVPDKPVPSIASVGVPSICGPLWVRPESDRLAALPAPSVMVARVEIDRGGGKGGGVLPGPDGVAEGQRTGAGAADIGGGAAVVERQRRRAAARPSPPRLKLSVNVTVLPASRSPLEGEFHHRRYRRAACVAVAATTASMMPPFSPEDAVATKPAWVADTIWYSDR